MTGSEVQLTDTVFDHNIAEQNGGAIAAKLGSHIVLIDSTNRFSSNTAIIGGALYLATNTTYEALSKSSVARRRQLSSFAEEAEFARELEAEYYSFNYTIEYEIAGADIFEYNNASKAGAALFWNHDSMLYRMVQDFELSTRVGNVALYGLPELAASTPAKFINATHEPGIEETSGGRVNGLPGPLKAPIVVAATDYYGNPTDLGLMGISEITLEGCEPLRGRLGNRGQENVTNTAGDGTLPCSLTGDVVSLPGEVTYPSKSFDFVQITLKPNTFLDITVKAISATPEAVILGSDGETKLKTTTHDSIQGALPEAVHPRDVYLGECKAGDKLINDDTVCASCNFDRTDVTPEGANKTVWDYPPEYGAFFCLGKPGREVIAETRAKSALASFRKTPRNASATQSSLSRIGGAATRLRNISSDRVSKWRPSQHFTQTSPHLGHRPISINTSRGIGSKICRNQSWMKTRSSACALAEGSTKRNPS